MNLKNFGAEVVLKLLEGKNKNLRILREQFKNSKIKKIEYTGVGFFIHYSVNPKKEKIKVKNMQIGGTCKINEDNQLYDILLFVRNGAIDFLEGVIFGEGQFPKEITSYRLNFSKEEIKKLLE